jgi:hypothetical protein
MPKILMFYFTWYISGLSGRGGRAPQKAMALLLQGPECACLPLCLPAPPHNTQKRARCQSKTAMHHQKERFCLSTPFAKFLTHDTTTNQQEVPEALQMVRRDLFFTTTTNHQPTIIQPSTPGPSTNHQPTINQPSTNHQPTIHQPSTNHPPTINQPSTKPNQTKPTTTTTSIPDTHVFSQQRIQSQRIKASLPRMLSSPSAIGAHVLMPS